MPTKCFKIGGLFFLFFSLNLSAQVTDPCSTGFEFEVIKIIPDPSSPQTPAFSQNSNPSMLHIYYKVRLKSTNGRPLPASLSYTYLSFNGKIGVNNHISKIDVKLSKQFSNTLNPLFPQIANAWSVSEAGEVDWSFGESYAGCTGSKMPATANLPAGASIDLFIIVVQAAPGETICWTEGPAADLQDCLSIPPCTGTIPVSHTGTLCHTFEYPQNCSPSVSLSFEPVQGTAPPATLIEVYLDNLQVGKPLTHIDGHLRLKPNMTGGAIVEFSIPALL